MRTPTSAAELLDALAAAGGRPRLTWYGADGERVELSGAVLANWVTKTTNLLVEELDLGPSGRLLLDLPTHWRTLVWALAAWRTGACVVVPPSATQAGDPRGAAGAGGGGAPGADVVVTDRPGAHAAAPGLVAVALPALARRFPGDLPAGALDAAGAVMTYGDVLGWVPDAVASDPAVDDGRTVRTHAELVPAAVAAAPDLAGRRVLLREGHPGARDVTETLATAVATWATDGSLVLVGRAAAQGLAADPGAHDRLVTTERVTAVR